MNKVIEIGRLAKDPEVRQGNTLVARFTLAVDRRGDGVDFINCVAFGKTAEFLEKYFKKGMRLAIEGRIQTGSYKNKEGKTVYTTDVVAEHAEFVESKKTEEEKAVTTACNDYWQPIPEQISLPFE